MRVAIFFIAALLAVAGWAQGVLPVPSLTGHVIDQTGSLSEAQAAALQNKLAAFEQAKGSQLVFLLVPTTQPEDIASYANRIGNAWKIGRKDVGDGLLLIVAKNDRKVRIEVAKTLEGAVPDLAAKQVIDEAITPAFKRGDFAGGLDAAADQLMARVSGEALPAPTSRSSGRGAKGFQWEDLAIFFFFAVPIGASVLRGLFGRKFGALLTAGGAGGMAMFITSSLAIAGVATVVGLLVALFSGLSSGGGRRSGNWGTGGWSSGSGGWSSGSGGGGFSSGGGGDFGGGGASGDW